jgi:hypothetical protein
LPLADSASSSIDRICTANLVAMEVAIPPLFGEANEIVEADLGLVRVRPADETS